MSYSGAGVTTVLGACVQAIGNVVSGGVELVSACGHALKDKMDEQEKRVNAQVHAHYTALIQRQDAMHAAIEGLASTIVISSQQTYGATAPLPEATSGWMAQAQAQVRASLEQVRNDLQGKTAQQAEAFLRKFQAERLADQQREQITLRARQLRSRLDTARRGGLAGNVADELEESIRQLGNLPIQQAIQSWQAIMSRLDATAARLESASTTGDYVRVRADQEYADALAYVQGQQLAANLDADLRDRTLDTFTAANEHLAQSRAYIDSNAQAARDEAEQARSMVLRAMKSAIEQVRHDRLDVTLDLQAAKSTIDTLAKLVEEMQAAQTELSYLEVSVGDEVQKFRDAQAQMEAIDLALQERNQPLGALKERAARLLTDATGLRGRLERKLSEMQRHIIAANLEEVMRGLGYTGVANSPRLAEQVLDGWRVVGTRPGAVGNREGATYVILENEGEISVIYDFAGFEGASCETAKAQIDEALARRGILIKEESAMKYKGHVHQQTIDKLVNIFKKMGYEHVAKYDVLGTVTIEAYNGPVGYTVTVDQNGQTTVTHNTDVGDFKETLTDVEMAAAQAAPGLSGVALGADLEKQKDKVGSYRAQRQVRGKGRMAQR
ncbi:MAG TPA: hypothetical protein VEW94_03410 [Chloroflexia bacterium]|nr:hypothetical protein [Chloroflexia bacterium]